jgi:hypothetical protein
MHVDALDRAARLARVEIRPVHEIFDGRLEGRIRTNVGGILAAELEVRGDEAPAGRLLHGVTTRDRAGERHEGDAPIANHARGVVVARVQALEDARRKTGLCERLRISIGHERRLLRHFQDHAVARHDCRHDRVH